MKRLFIQLRLALFVMFFGWIMYILPREAVKTWIWISKMPVEE